MMLEKRERDWDEGEKPDLAQNRTRNFSGKILKENSLVPQLSAAVFSRAPPVILEKRERDWYEGEKPDLAQNRTRNFSGKILGDELS